jgi:membrane protease YdiL (CAAX protease family)
MEDISATASIPLLRKILIVLGKILLFLVLSALFIFLLSLPVGALIPQEQDLVIVRRLVSKQPLASAGLGIKKWLPELGEGYLLGVILVGFGYVLLLLSGMAQSQALDFIPISFLGWFLFFLIQPFLEELLFRGYLMSLLGRYFNIPVALIISSLAFAAVHADNDNFSSIGFLTITIAGVLFGLLFLKTGQLWLATGMHAAWNFMQGVVFGIPTSGNRTYSIMETTTNGPAWLSGGAFGFEGSILAVLVIIAAIWWYKESYRQEKLSAVANLTLNSPVGPIALEVQDDPVE